MLCILELTILWTAANIVRISLLLRLIVVTKEVFLWTICYSDISINEWKRFFN